MLSVPYGASTTTLSGVLSAKLSGSTLHAFASNHTPAVTDTESTYDAIEAVFGGYSAITLNAWAAPVLNAGNKAESDETVRTWTATGSNLPVTLYGVYCKDSGGKLLFAEQNPTGGITLSAAGQQFSYLPRYTLVQE